ncbi:single-strand DNA-binding protein [Georgenia satyanarayanai]|uniref:Single-stranded DNA-binding protein n=1 Tax=Georgenia satyanarayanai TaxID=860221 RepID=A0A2Y9AB58_9MICO|nr:single-stranded DNA-binding protein [Georgenia satyanarayanai]PYG00219.1 single-strand DNA-binding protein [Georgenia satyanarayanai]SSA40478.1 single-strand DNA-binding protein [Georgenia satyanarayanai]
MSDTNQITVRGRVGTDPEIVVTANGREVTRFRLACTRSYRDSAGEWRETATEWFTVKTWGPGGTIVQRSVRRGMPVLVQGTFSSEEWTGPDRTSHTNVITAGVIAVDIKYGLVTYAKVVRETPAEGGAAGEGMTGADEERKPEDSGTPPAEGLEPADPWEKAPAEV